MEQEKLPTLPKSDREEFWNLIDENFDYNPETRWKCLAILALRENAGWKLEDIGTVFGHPKGHISRIIKRTKDLLREQFQPEIIEEMDD